jgi:hypothetical protein
LIHRIEGTLWSQFEEAYLLRVDDGCELPDARFHTVEVGRDKLRRVSEVSITRWLQIEKLENFPKRRSLCFGAQLQLAHRLLQFGLIVE